MSSSEFEDFLKNGGKAKEEYEKQNQEYKERQERQKKLGLGDEKRGKYDEMDYGDEFNDDEEKAYKKEAYGSDEEEEEGEEEESSFDPPAVVPLAKDFSKRANRGNRMTALVERAQDEEEDDDFWGGVGRDFFGVAANGEEELEEASKSFEEGDISDKSAGVDSFDSDFGKGDEESDE